MAPLLRHLLPILMPIMNVAVIPYWLIAAFGAGDSRWEGYPITAVPVRLGGAAALSAGGFLFLWCVRLFARVGEGTLAPWDPTRKLVAVGPYRHVRNPMISGVALMLLGEALVRGSWVLGTWTGTFLLINHGYFVASEEPGLEKRYGAAYRVYKENVPRWIPRPRRWSAAPKR